MGTQKLTMTQALVKYLMAQKRKMEETGEVVPLFGGIWAIFGHGNVAGIGEALYPVREEFPTFRGHNEQSMGHAAIAFAKATRRQRMMACTSSIGPGAMNMVAASATAFANRLPALFLPGDIFATRSPDPVLQQIEHFGDPNISVNDCFKPVSRYYDRINLPEQLLSSLPQAISTLCDPINCGPVTLALPQDSQTFAFDYPDSFFEENVWVLRRQTPDQLEIQRALELIKKAKKPFIIAGGGVHYSFATEELSNFSKTFKIPVAETQAGKGALTWDHPFQAGSIGVTGSTSANELAREADLVISIGSRLQDFTTGSWSLFQNPETTLLSLNVGSFDANKHRAVPLIGDVKMTLNALSESLKGYEPPSDWVEKGKKAIKKWNEIVSSRTDRDDSKTGPVSDPQVIGAVNRAAGDQDIVVGAAGGLPGELHKNWRASHDKAYHMEYAFSCMGYEIAGGLGVKMADPTREIFVMVGDGSYLMLNSELATSVLLGRKIILVVTDNHGYGCINRLQNACGGEPFNNLFKDCEKEGDGIPPLNFEMHTKSLGALSETVTTIKELEEALERAKKADQSYAIVIETDPNQTTPEGGNWWEVPIAEVSDRKEVNESYKRYLDGKKDQKV